MKILAPLVLSSILLVSACANSPHNVTAAPSPVMAQPPVSVHSYHCESGERIVANYPSTESATVQYKGRTYNMFIAVSGSGARYVSGDLEWWTKGNGPGSEGRLLHHNVDGTPGVVIEHCTIP